MHFQEGSRKKPILSSRGKGLHNGACVKQCKGVGEICKTTNECCKNPQLECRGGKPSTNGSCTPLNAQSKYCKVEHHPREIDYDNCHYSNLHEEVSQYFTKYTCSLVNDCPSFLEFYREEIIDYGPGGGLCKSVDEQRIIGCEYQSGQSCLNLSEYECKRNRECKRNKESPMTPNTCQLPNEEFSCVYDIDEGEDREERENVYYRLYINNKWIDFTQHPELRDQYLCKNSSAKNPDQDEQGFYYDCCHSTGGCKTCVVRKEYQGSGSPNPPEDDGDICVHNNPPKTARCKDSWKVKKVNTVFTDCQQHSSIGTTTWECEKGGKIKSCSETFQSQYDEGC